ncbi:MAG: tyrosine-protein phosphatase, partial [Polyangiaceae bacterium]
MRGYVDLHCHWVAAIDDGARTTDEGLTMLRRLHEVGFDDVVATPHMRPGMFDNDRPRIERAFQDMQRILGESARAKEIPAVHLASEHFFDDVVFNRLVRGDALPYRPSDASAAPSPAPAGGPSPATRTSRHRCVLIEFGQGAFPLRVQHRFFDLRRAGLQPVLAHPERYYPVWKDDACLDPLLDAGAHLLLDVCALVGKYGRAPQRAAEKLLEDDAYEAACSDAHRPADVDIVATAI